MSPLCAAALLYGSLEGSRRALVPALLRSNSTIRLRPRELKGVCTRATGPRWTGLKRPVVDVWRPAATAVAAETVESYLRRVPSCKPARRYPVQSTSSEAMAGGSLWKTRQRFPTRGGRRSGPSAARAASTGCRRGASLLEGVGARSWR